MRIVLIFILLFATSAATAQPAIFEAGSSNVGRTRGEMEHTLTPMEQKRQLLNKAMASCIGHARKDVSPQPKDGPKVDRAVTWDVGFEYCVDVMKENRVLRLLEEAAIRNERRGLRPSAGQDALKIAKEIDIK